MPWDSPWFDLLDSEAGFYCRVVQGGRSGDDLELERFVRIAQGNDFRWNLELCLCGREVDAELDVSLLDEELISDDFDGTRFSDLGMRLRHRIPVDDDGLAD